MENSPIIVEKKNSIWHIKLNRRKEDNKLSISCLEEMRHVLELAAQDRECRAIIISGNEKWFCAGGEIGDVTKKSVLEIKAFGKAFIDFHLAVQDCPRPVIAAVEGKAFGGGCSVVEACDLCVAGETAELAVPEIQGGLAPAMGFSGLYKNLSKKDAMAMGLLGKKMTAQEAKRLGLVNEVVPKEKVMETAFEMAETIAGFNPTAVRLFKEMYADMGQRDYENRLKIGQGTMIALFKSKGE